MGSEGEGVEEGRGKVWKGAKIERGGEWVPKRIWR